MRTSEVVQILDALEHQGVRFWLTGGWGVDALHGEATREHRDLDLAIDAESFGMARGDARGNGIHRRDRLAPSAPGDGRWPGGWVDLHPVRFDKDGDGVQQGLDGVTFGYRAADLVVGSIAARRVPFISHRLQGEFHAGYDLRPQDLHDLRILTGLKAESP